MNLDQPNLDPVTNNSRILSYAANTMTFILPNITKTESNNVLLYHVLVKENNEKTHYVEEANQPATLLLRCALDATPPVNLALLLEIVHCARNPQITYNL